jgi:MFS transporter, MHS family, citrate/tricarballylate:H+ symporter
VLKPSEIDSMIVTFCVALSNLFRLPVMGGVSGRIDRRPILMVFNGVDDLDRPASDPMACQWTDVRKMLAVLLWLSFLYGCYNGAWSLH